MNKILFLSPLLLLAIIPFAFADHTDATIQTVEGSSLNPDCAVEDGCYDPMEVTVGVGGVVTMTNTDTTGVHTFTSGPVNVNSATPDNVFNSSMLTVGESFQWNTHTVGEFPYYCMRHSWMQGVIIVEDGHAEPTISVTTDHDKYEEGETILITGTVSEIIPGYAVFYSVIAPNGNLVALNQLTVDADKKFSTSLAAGGPLWRSEGTYTVKVQYGDDKNIVAETTFEFSGSTPNEEEPEDKPIPAWVKGVFVYWGNGEISDDELKSAITFLVESGIIIIK